jgi:hypothetical protein
VYEYDRSVIRNFRVGFGLMSKATKIEEIIQQRCVRKLVHFTRVSNLKSIIELGILPRLELEKKKIKVEFNDQQRIDLWPDTSSISVTEKNLHLFPKFVERSKTKENDWFDILIHPSILTEKECIFCDTNAANHRFDEYRKKQNFLKSHIAFENMFAKFIPRTSYGQGIKRENQKDNETTSNQAEICVYGTIEKRYFLNLKEIEATII